LEAEEAGNEEMRITFTIDYYPFYTGKLIREIARRLEPNGVEARIVTSDIRPEINPDENENNVVRLRARSLSMFGSSYIVYDPWSILSSRKILDVDVINSHFAYAFLSFYMALMKRIKKIRAPIVVTCHGMPTGYASAVVEATAQLIRLLSNKLVIKKASAVTTVSRQQYHYLNKFIPTERLYHIPNGVDTCLFKPDNKKRRELREEMKINEDNVLVLYFARMRAAKGVLIFLKTIRRILRKLANIRILMAGSGSLANHVKEMTVKHPKKMQALLQYIPDKMLPYLYNASDIYVLPSYVEGMPLTLMEAMACGKPVIATNVGDVPNLVENGVNGIVLPLVDADLLTNGILHLAKNATTRDSMGVANVKKISEYDWDKIARQYHSLYLRVTESDPY